MVITLDSGKQIEVVAINLSGGYVDFKWIDEAYGGICNVAVAMEAGKELDGIEGRIKSSVVAIGG